jgi:hypothetical protein
MFIKKKNIDVCINYPSWIDPISNKVLGIKIKSAVISKFLFLSSNEISRGTRKLVWTLILIIIKIQVCNENKIIINSIFFQIQATYHILDLTFTCENH